MRILLIESDAETAFQIAASVSRTGQTIDWMSNVRDGSAAIAVQDYDAMILGIGLSSRSCEETLSVIKAVGGMTPILALSRANDANARIECLNLGADDCLSRPFDMGELIARTQALSRRRYGLRSDTIRFGELEFDCVSKMASVNDELIPLTRKESSTLEILVAHDGKPVHKERIHQNLYGFDNCEVGLGAVELYVSRLRKKLRATRVSIKTVRHFGYQLCHRD